MAHKITLFILFVFSSLVLGRENFPATVDEAASILVRELKDDAKEEIVSKTKDDLIDYHHGWGTGIRNDFGLWRGNRKLLSDCGGERTHPDTCSMHIIEKVWEKLRLNYPKEYIQKIDYLNLALHKITISPYLVNDSGIIEYVKFLNSEIEKSSYAGQFTLSVACTSRHYRLKDFYHKGSGTLHDAFAALFVGQMVAKVKIKPNKILISPLPFKDSEACSE